LNQFPRFRLISQPLCHPPELLIGTARYYPDVLEPSMKAGFYKKWKLEDFCIAALHAARDDWMKNCIDRPAD
jgi:hypothetical protein